MHKVRLYGRYFEPRYFVGWRGVWVRALNALRFFVERRVCYATLWYLRHAEGHGGDWYASHTGQLRRDFDDNARLAKSSQPDARGQTTAPEPLPQTPLPSLDGLARLQAERRQKPYAFRRPQSAASVEAVPTPAEDANNPNWEVQSDTAYKQLKSSRSFNRPDGPDAA